MSEVSSASTPGDLEGIRHFRFEFMNNATKGVSYNWLDAMENVHKIIFLIVPQLRPSRAIGDGSVEGSYQDFQRESLIWTSKEPILLNNWLPIVASWIHDYNTNESDKHYVCRQEQRPKTATSSTHSNPKRRSGPVRSFFG